MTAEVAGDCLWGVWYVTWWVPALWSPKPSARLPHAHVPVDRILAGIGTVLVFFVRRAVAPWPLAPLWRERSAVAWMLIGTIVAAFGFCWWARLHLGRLWSGAVTLKPLHHVVDTGPYGLVRHPIYTGVIAAAWALALIKTTPVALVGAALIAVGFWLTARKEEGFLRERLGTAVYDAYSRRTPMLAPLPRRRVR